MPILNIFEDDAFSLISLTNAVSELPVAPTQIHEMKLFHSEGIKSSTFAIEKETGSNTLVAYTPRGGPGETSGNNQRVMRSFVVPHIQRDDKIMADEVQDLREFGSEDRLATVASLVKSRMAKHIAAIDMTIEHQRVGAIKGIILDKFGNIVENLYTSFDVAPPDPINMALTVGSTKVREKSNSVSYLIEDALEGAYPGQIQALCGRDFWDALINHDDVRDIYKSAGDTAALLGKEPDSLQVGNILFRRYKISPSAKAASANGGGFIAMDKARVFPTGVPDMFITKFGPADYNETVNHLGLPRYAKQIPKANGKGTDIEVQSNPLSLCTRPAALFELTIA